MKARMLFTGLDKIRVIWIVALVLFTVRYIKSRDLIRKRSCRHMSSRRIARAFKMPHTSLQGLNTLLLLHFLEVVFRYYSPRLSYQHECVYMLYVTYILLFGGFATRPTWLLVRWISYSCLQESFHVISFPNISCSYLKLMVTY